MSNNIENDQLVNLVSKIRHISLNQQDLIDVSLEYLTLYFKNNLKDKNYYEKFWDNDFYVEKVCLVAREGVILGMQAITLDKDIHFSEIIKYCLSYEINSFDDNEISENIIEQNTLNNFLSYLRKELFIKIYNQNKKLQKETQIPTHILKDRYDIFVNYQFD